MKPAARRDDPTAHGGKIAQGEATVLIGGKPAARLGDPHVCPMVEGVKPHLGGPIATSSSRVMIGNAFAARQGDGCGCLLAGPPGASGPSAGGGASGSAATRQWSNDGQMDADTDNKESIRGAHAEAELTDQDGDGTLDSARAEASAARMRNKASASAGPVEVGGVHNLDVLYGRAQGGASKGAIPHSSADESFGANAAGEAGVVKWGGGAWAGAPGDDGRNPIAAANVEGDVLHAEAKGDVLVGDDGRRVGVGAMGKAGAEVVSGNVQGRNTIPLPFGYNIQSRAKVTGALGTAGVGAGAWAYWDRKEERLHIGALGELKAIAGGELDVDFSIGKAYAPDPPPSARGKGADGAGSGGAGDAGAGGDGAGGGAGGGGAAGGGPNVITAGCGSVLIG